MEAGWKFLKMTITGSYTNSLTRAVNQTLAQTSSKTTNISCDNENIWNPWGTTLWQWAGVSPDGTIITTTALNVCRYNELAESPPDCPPSACLMNSWAF